MSATIVANCCADIFRNAVQISDQVIQWICLADAGVFVQSCIQVSYISVMVTIVVNFHCLLHRYVAQVHCLRKEELVIDVPLYKYLLKIM